MNSHQKVNIFYNGLGTMNRQLLELQGLIPGMTHAQALTAILTMVDHSQKLHDGSSSRNIDSGNSNSEGITTIISKLDSLGRDIKKLKENMHAIQVGCQLCGGAHLEKECPLNEEVKSAKEVKYREFGRPSPFGNGAKYRVGPPRYYTCIDNRLPFGEKMEELMNKHLEEYRRRSNEMGEWERRSKKARMFEHEINVPSMHFCKLVKQNCNGVVKWMFDLEIYQLGDEYELGIGKKGHMLNDIWENCSLSYEEEFKDTPTRSHMVKRGYEFSQDTRVKSSSLAIIIRSEEQCSGESLVLTLLLFFNFHFLNGIIGTLYKPSKEMGVDLPLDLYLPLIF
ncbi:hypothetical protein Tco_0260940 [Tanacetum coccineum]